MPMARTVTAIVIAAFSLYFIGSAVSSFMAGAQDGSRDPSADVIVILSALTFTAACLAALTRFDAEVNTMRTMEYFMAVVMGIFSVYLMKKSAELPIWWIKGAGPGGGAWPFWIAAIMLATCFMVLWNWFKKTSPIAASEDVYMDDATLIDVGQVAIALIITVALFYFIGVYGALPLFLIFYVRFFGRNSWPITAVMAFAVPVVCFFFFEIALKIILPKGYTEPLFYPLYKIFL
jgi:putative tricarboxylic transport membrane protein